MKKRIKKDKDDPVGGKPGEKGLSMKFLNKLERKFGRYAVPNLMLYIIILNAAGLLITIMYPQAQYYLCWSTSAILHGQIWRIVSFILVPYTTSPVNFLIFAFLYYSISQTLERVWGSFRMDMYIITGLLGTIVAAFLVYFVFGVEMGMQVSISYLSNSLFLALAATFPDVQFLLFFIIPIKAKWMALLSAVMYLYDLMQVVNGLGWMPYGFAMLIMIVFSLINFILFSSAREIFSGSTPKRYIEEEIFKRRWGRGNKAAGHCISAPYAEEQIRIFQIWSFVIVQSVTALTSIAASIFIRISTLLHIRMIISNMTGSNWQRL